VTGFLYGLRAILSLLCLEVLKGYISGKNFSILLLYLQIKRYFVKEIVKAEVIRKRYFEAKRHGKN
jgi:hypothetical protein